MKIVLMNLSLWTLVLDLHMYKAQSLNILGIFPYPGKSHFLAIDRYLTELAIRGHNVTVISYFPRNETLTNYRDISLSGATIHLENIVSIHQSHWELLKITYFLMLAGTENCQNLLENKHVQELWVYKAKFDVIVTEQFISDCSLGLAHKLGGPVVAVSSHVIVPWLYSRFGIPYNPSYMPFQSLGGGTKPTFFERVERTFYRAYYIALFKLVCQRTDQNTLALHFDDIPPLDELGHQIKFLLTANSFMFTGTTLFPSNIIEVGGYHIHKAKQLPGDILEFIEKSENGVIYVSFGSIFKTSTIPKEKLQIIVEVLSALPQRVLWKWENASLPRSPNKIFLSSWLPQNDILAHPNVVAFYSHCGMLSLTEAVHHGVPVVGMPIFGDHPGNAGFLEESGLGVQIQFKDLTKEKLLEHFRIVLDPSFRERVKLLSKAWHDRPVSALDSAVHWTEFAARYPNFTFTSPAVRVPFYQYYALDVFLFFLISLILSLILFRTIIIYCVCLYTNMRSKHKLKPHKKD